MCQTRPAPRPIVSVDGRLSYLCIDCGAELTKKGKRGQCPLRCQGCKRKAVSTAARSKVHSRICRKCETQFNSTGSPNRVYCDQCLASHPRRKDRGHAECLHCRVTFDVKHGTLGLYCSNKCAGAANANKKKLRNRRSEPEVLAELLSYIENANARDSEKQRDRVWRMVLRELKRIVRNERSCVVCGEIFYRCRSNAVTCSDECKKIRARQMKPKGCQRHPVRAKRRGLPRDYGVTIDKVLAVHGPGCALCGGETTGTGHERDPLSATVDHIVPLNHPLNFRHGHTWSNVQIAHRRCNELKGCTVADDRLLFCESPANFIKKQRINQSKGGCIAPITAPKTEMHEVLRREFMGTSEKLGGSDGT